MLLPQWLRVSCLVFIGLTLVGTPPCGFGRVKQLPLSELRERTGLAIRRKVQVIQGPDLNKGERKLVSNIAIASEKRDWSAAQSYFATYRGDATQIYGAAIHAAFRCGQYQEGAKIYEQCRSNCKLVGAPVFTVALRIFGKLKANDRVRQIWDDALKAHELDEILGSARIAAAADLGDVEGAAAVLDQMNLSSNVSINVFHINSAMRACWGWGNKEYKAAKYFFDLLEQFQLSPTIVSFTSLVGAYHTASLPEILSAYQKMKDLEIEPDPVFAETYMFSVLQADRSRNLRRGIEDRLHEKAIKRLQAARDALIDFKKAGVQLQGSCRAIDKQLRRMGIWGGTGRRRQT